jgi:hypothetical protein
MISRWKPRFAVLLLLAFPVAVASAQEMGPAPAPVAEDAPKLPPEVAKQATARADTLMAPVLPEQFKTDTLTGRQIREAVASAGGNAISAVRSRLEVKSEFTDKIDYSGTRFTTLRADVPLSPIAEIRFDLPVGFYDPPEGSADARRSALGDARVKARMLALNEQDYAVGLSLELSFPTATATQTGRGKYLVIPGAAFSWATPRLRSSTTFEVKQYYSVAGHEDRPDVQYLRLNAAFETPWGARYWSVVEPFLYVDRMRGSATSAVIEFEAGYKIDQNTRVFARYGVGLWHATPVGAYNYMFQLGFRYLGKRRDVVRVARIEEERRAGEAADEAAKKAAQPKRR